jgi:dihydroxycyclohexadiene carboxylate dehydrogenase
MTADENFFSPGRFDGKVCVVTGSAQGIGKASAVRMAREGGTVVIADRAAEPAAAVVQELADEGLEATAAVHDLGSWEGASAMTAQVLEQHGRIDVQVNNAGGTIWIKPFLEYEPWEIEAEVERSFWPTMWCCRAVLPQMVERGSGSVINLGSNSVRGPLRLPYAASKGGVIALTTSLSVELAKTGVRLNCVAPGGTKVPERPTPRNPFGVEDAQKAENYAKQVGEFVHIQMPMGRMGHPHEQAAAICFLASDEASFITGQVLSVAGGAAV